MIGDVIITGRAADPSVGIPQWGRSTRWALGGVTDFRGHTWQDRFEYMVISALDMAFTLSSLGLHHSSSYQALTDIWDYRLLLCKFVALDLLWFTVCICQFLIRLAICRKLLPFSQMVEELPFSSINGKMHNSSVTGTIHWEVMVS